MGQYQPFRSLLNHASRHLEHADECPRSAHKAAEIIQVMASKLPLMNQRLLRLEEIESIAEGKVLPVEGDESVFRVVWSKPDAGLNPAGHEIWQDLYSSWHDNQSGFWTPFYPRDAHDDEIYLIASFLETVPGYARENPGNPVQVVAGRHNGAQRFEIRCPNELAEPDRPLVVGIMERFWKERSCVSTDSGRLKQA